MKDNAISEGKKAVGLLPESEDAFDGPRATVALAEIYARVGEHDKALCLLDHLLTVPRGLTVATLKLESVWAPLRKDPRFQNSSPRKRRRLISGCCLSVRCQIVALSDFDTGRMIVVPVVAAMTAEF